MSSKTFFESLEPKSALIVGVVTGVLAIGTVGFLIMLGVYFGGKDSAKENTPANTQTADQPAQEVTQAPKSTQPKVELFVMSHCPYGLQMEKAFLPAWNLLKDKAVFTVKFVNYAMHGLKEVQEEMRQVCVAEQGEEKMIKYLQCFTLADEPEKCLGEAGVNKSTVESCVAKLDTKYGIMKAYNDQSTWLSGRFPIFSVNDDLNKKYGVQGSPTLVINGAQISVGRSPEAVKQAVCGAFNTAPEECKTQLSTANVSPSFGAGTAGDQAAAADCGV